MDTEKGWWTSSISRCWSASPSSCCQALEGGAAGDVVGCGDTQQFWSEPKGECQPVKRRRRKVGQQMWSEVSEGFSSSNGFAGIAAMVLGAVFVLLVLTVVIGALLWGAGKLGRGGEGRTRGLWMVFGSLAGAVIVGTSAAAVAWSSTAGGTEGGLNALMPEDARPGETRIEVEDVLVNCQQPVSWEADTSFWSPKPSEEEDAHGRQLLEDLGVLETYDKRTGSDSWLTDIGDIGGVVSVSWQPAGGDCSVENRTAIGGSTITAETYLRGPNITGSKMTHDVELKAPESDDGDSGSSD